MVAEKPEISAEPLEPLILRLRGRRVMLDSDLARLYGVTTLRFNEAFKRNKERFPDDFAFRLTAPEFSNLRSQSAISSLQLNEIKNKTRSWGGRRYLPWVFTEHGALMVANVLRSAHAVQMSVFVIRAFVRMREQISANNMILKRLAEIDRTLLDQDKSLQDIYEKLRPLLGEFDPPGPIAPPKRPIGLVRGDE